MVEVQVTERGGVPTGAEAAVINVTTAREAGTGFVTVWSCGERPLASLVNFVADRTVANSTVLRLSESGSLCAYMNTSTELFIDVTGYET